LITRLKLYIPFIFIWALSDAVAQHKIGLKFNVGASKITRNYTFPTSFSITSKLEPSFSGGAFYEFHFSNKSLLSAELLYTLINTKEEFSRTLYDQNQNAIGSEYSTITTHTSSLSLPILYGYRARSLTVLLGIQVSNGIASRGTNRGFQIENGTQTYSWSFDLSSSPLQGFDYGLRLGLYYALNNRISIETNYYHGLNNLGTESTVLKIRQMVLGIRYKFFDKK
jgi:hypothetical protein